LAPSSSEKPMTANTSWTCGMDFSSASTWRAVALVRDTEAPSGSWRLRKNAPWSSSGRKLVGVMRDIPQVPSPITTRSGSDRMANRTSLPTAQA
jgi:hypothetical protein